MSDTGPAGGADADVVIVGAGPVGVALALLLVRFGVRVSVLERAEQVPPWPRAVSVDDEAQRLLEDLGVRLNARPLAGMRLVDERDRLLLHFDRDPADQPLGFPRAALVHQPHLEHALRDRLEEVAPGTLRSGVAVERVDPATAPRTERALAVGTDAGTVETDWAVGCDGAHSTVRGLAGVAHEERGRPQSWLVVDLLADPPPGHPPEVLQICDPARPATSVPVGGGRHRLEWRLLPGEDEAALLRRLPELLVPHVDASRVEVERAAAYTFRARVAERFVVGRVLLAGDAAHEMPPFLGQGLCAGLRDVANLGWKLGAVVRGTASPSLLATYQAERRPHVVRVVDVSDRVGRVIGDRSRGRAVLRNHVLAATAAVTGGRVGPAAQRMPPLPPGPLVGRGAGHPLPDPAASPPGGSAPDGLALRRLLGHGFALVRLGGWEPAPGLFAAARGIGLRKVVARGREHSAWERAAPGARALLVRPDLIVAGVLRDEADAVAVGRGLLRAGLRG